MTQPIPARAPMTSHGVQIPRPAEPGGMFRARLEPQIFRNSPAQIIRTTPSWTPPARPPAPPPAAAQALVQAAPQVPAPQAPPQAASPPVPAAASPAPPASPAAVAPAATPAAAAPPAETPAATAPAPTAPADGGPPLGPDEYAPIPGEMTFRQFLQGLNPLHHLPGVGMIYRAVTGAEIHPVMRVLGGAAFGPIGMITAAVGAAFEATRPMERLSATWAGRPDPHMPAPGSAAARAAAAYARFGESS
ncbi:hypothetical protein [Roseococcus microcysteis]|uniref:hypothetical protein n=1 Tax=Roseococcus microcysteis TaxID=2771361 RepID=UPI00168A87BD|nr:hypothetical protein [Roseococcus microcysteis]